MTTTLNPVSKEGRTPAHPSTGVTPLMQACQQCKDGSVRQLLHKDPSSVQSRDKTGKTALHYCIENTALTCIDQLLNSDPSLISARDEDGYTALHLATIAGNKSVVKFLLSKGADIHAIDNEEHTVIHWATVCGEAELLDLLIDCGADPSTPDIHGAYPIHYAAQMCGPNSELGQEVQVGLQVLQKLLKRGVDVHVKDHDGREPLLWAASAEVRPSHVYCLSGSADAILALVNAGADVAAEDKDGLTALHCAASRGHLDCQDVLISLCSAEVDTLDSNGCTPLFYAATLGHADCTEHLLKHGAVPDRQDRKGRTPAHCGAAKGQLETLKLLHNRGADLWKKNIKGDLPLHEACQSGRRDLVIWLLSLRPDAVNAANNDGRCPLHIAAINNNTEMCKVVMDHKAPVNPIMRNTRGQLLTPVDAAVARGNRGCAKYLQLHGGVPASKLTDKRALQIAMQEALVAGPAIEATGATPSDVTASSTPNYAKTPSTMALTPSMLSSSVGLHMQNGTNELNQSSVSLQIGASSFSPISVDSQSQTDAGPQSHDAETFTSDEHIKNVVLQQNKTMLEENNIEGNKNGNSKTSENRAIKHETENQAGEEESGAANQVADQNKNIESASQNENKLNGEDEFTDENKLNKGDNIVNGNEINTGDDVANENELNGGDDVANENEHNNNDGIANKDKLNDENDVANKDDPNDGDDVANKDELNNGDDVANEDEPNNEDGATNENDFDNKGKVMNKNESDDKDEVNNENEINNESGVDNEISDDENENHENTEAPDNDFESVASQETTTESSSETSQTTVKSKNSSVSETTKPSTQAINKKNISIIKQDNVSEEHEAKSDNDNFEENEHGLISNTLISGNPEALESESKSKSQTQKSKTLKKGKSSETENSKIKINKINASKSRQSSAATNSNENKNVTKKESAKGNGNKTKVVRKGKNNTTNASIPISNNTNRAKSEDRTDNKTQKKNVANERSKSLDKNVNEKKRDISKNSKSSNPGKRNEAKTKSNVSSSRIQRQQKLVTNKGGSSQIQSDEEDIDSQDDSPTQKSLLKRQSKYSKNKLSAPERELGDGASEDGEVAGVLENESDSTDIKNKKKRVSKIRSSKESSRSSKTKVADESDADRSASESNAESDGQKEENVKRLSRPRTAVRNSSSSKSTKSKQRMLMADKESLYSNDERTHELILPSSGRGSGLVREAPSDIIYSPTNLSMQGGKDFKTFSEMNSGEGSESVSEYSSSDEEANKDSKRKRKTNKKMKSKANENGGRHDYPDSKSQIEIIGDGSLDKMAQQELLLRRLNEEYDMNESEEDEEMSESGSEEDFEANESKKNESRLARNNKRKTKLLKKNTATKSLSPSKSDVKRILSGGPRKVESMETSMKKKKKDPVTEMSIMQAMQTTTRKYSLERRLFQQLLDLKRVQIRNSRANEHVMIKRLVDEYNKDGNHLVMRKYTGPYNFATYEKYLYDQLRMLQTSQGNKVPRFKANDDIDRLTKALRKANVPDFTSTLDDEDRSPHNCNHSTHRCHHAIHAYTGVPCAAYLAQNNRNAKGGKVNLPRIPPPHAARNDETDKKNSEIRSYDNRKPLRVELQPSSKGRKKQEVSISTETANLARTPHDPPSKPSSAKSAPDVPISAIVTPVPPKEVSSAPTGGARVPPQRKAQVGPASALVK